jgi:hypothetical protein
MPSLVSADVAMETIRQRSAALTPAIDALPEGCALAAFLADMRDCYDAAEKTLAHLTTQDMIVACSRAGLVAAQQDKTPHFVAMSDLTIAFQGLRNADVRDLR